MSLMKKMDKIIEQDKMKKVAGGAQISYTEDGSSDSVGQRMSAYDAVDNLTVNFRRNRNEKQQSDAEIIIVKNDKEQARITWECYKKDARDPNYIISFDRVVYPGYGKEQYNDKQSLFQAISQRGWS